MLVLAAWIASVGLATEPLVLDGAVPPSVPDGTVLAAQIVADSREEVGDPVATAVVAAGRFELTLPAAVDAELLETDRLGCDETDLLEVGYMPYLLVLDDEGEAVGQLLLTDAPRELWSFGGPANQAYWLYTPEPFAAAGKCQGGELDLDLQAGWNAVLLRQGQGGLTFASEPAPDAFAWFYAPLQ